MKTKVILIILTFFWVGLKAQTFNIGLKESAGDCLLQSSCDENVICYDLFIQIEEPNWALRSYNIWFQYPVPPFLIYNSDNACLTQNGGDTDNNAYGQYRVSGVNGSSLLVSNVPVTIHSMCFEYADGNLILDSLIRAGGPAMIYGFPFESTITLVNTVTGQTSALSISSATSIAVELKNKQKIDVFQGWSGISAWLEPNNPGIGDMFSPVVSNLVLMYNYNGGIYYPEHNINTINNWNYHAGYIIKVTGDISLNICGTEASDKNLNLTAGWNIIPVLSRSDVPVEEVFGALGNNLVVAKEIAGYKLYYPAFSINSLGSLQPGKAYYVKVLAACTITFPEAGGSKASVNHDYYFEQISPWNPIVKTPNSHLFCFDIASHGIFETGDLIGAFDQNGACTGMMEVLDSNSPFAVPVFANDETTESKDGLNDGEEISFRLWRPSSGEDFNLELVYREDSPSHGNFVSNGISLVKDIKMNSSGTTINNFLLGVELSIFPNPTASELNLKLAGDVLIEGKTIFTNSNGQILFTKEMKHNAGISNRVFDLSKYPTGVYYLRVISANYYNIQKVIIE
jgi:hypothetical protein